jgi:hypothetical protein
VKSFLDIKRESILYKINAVMIDEIAERVRNAIVASIKLID